MKVALGTLKDSGDDLVTFLEPRVGTKPSLSGDSIEIEDENVREGVKPRHVKTYIKRFLYMKGVRRKYRVFVAGKDLTIQEIEVGEEEEEEKKKEGAKKPEEAKQEEVKAEEPEEEPPEPPKEEAQEPKGKPKKASTRKPRAKKKKED